MATKKSSEIKVRRFGFHDLPVPTQATPGSAGYDLCNVESVKFTRTLIVPVKTGWCFEIPEGHVGIVRVRSGMAKEHRIKVASSGIIDADYRGEIVVWVEMHTTGLNVVFRPGTRLFQMVIVPCSHLPCKEVKVLSKTSRGDKGFGSTGQ